MIRTEIRILGIFYYICRVGYIKTKRNKTTKPSLYEKEKNKL
jgi:hypothetical protein